MLLRWVLVLPLGPLSNVLWKAHHIGFIHGICCFCFRHFSETLTRHVDPEPGEVLDSSQPCNLWCLRIIPCDSSGGKIRLGGGEEMSSFYKNCRAVLKQMKYEWICYNASILDAEFFSSGSFFNSHVIIKDHCAYVYIFILTLQILQINTFVFRLTSLVFMEHRNDLVEVIVLSWYWTAYHDSLKSPWATDNLAVFESYLLQKGLPKSTPVRTWIIWTDKHMKPWNMMAKTFNLVDFYIFETVCFFWKNSSWTGMNLLGQVVKVGVVPPLLNSDHHVMQKICVLKQTSQNVGYNSTIRL